MSLAPFLATEPLPVELLPHPHWSSSSAIGEPPCPSPAFSFSLLVLPFISFEVGHCAEFHTLQEGQAFAVVPSFAVAEEPRWEWELHHLFIMPTT